MSEAADIPATARKSGSTPPAAVHARASERLRIARELHDVVGSGLTTVQLQAEAAAILLDGRPEDVREALADIRRTSGEALRELRAILGMMRAESDAARPRRRPTPPIPALASAATRAGVATDVVVSGEPRRIPPEVDHAASRIVQESLTNVLRHSGAAAASVRVAYEDDRVTVEVEDDGRPAPSSPGGHHGIVGMRERAYELGGELDARPRPQGGFVVRAMLPLRGAA